MIADAGYLSEKLTAFIKAHAGWTLTIVKRSEPEFAIVDLDWTVERTFAWLGRERRLPKDYETEGANLRNLDPDRCLQALFEADCQLIQLLTHPLNAKLRRGLRKPTALSFRRGAPPQSC